MTSSVQQRRTKAAIALILIVAAASGGLAARFYIPGAFGQGIFTATRVWLLGCPLIWFLNIDKGALTWAWPSTRDFNAGLILGIIMAGIIGIAYLLLGQQWLTPSTIQAKAQAIGLAQPLPYLGFSLYFTFINALVEEYIWRWFVYQKCTLLLNDQGAVLLAALCFTLHHIIALVGYTGTVMVTVFGSIGVFVAGAIWSWCFLKYQSLWVCYISHALADLAIALIGWDLLF